MQGDSSYSSSPNYTRAIVNASSVAVQFKTINGWNLPTNQTVTVLPGQVTVYNAQYIIAAAPPVLMANKNGISISGTVGATFRIEMRTALTSGNWVPVSTNNVTSSGFHVVLPITGTNQSAAFYRAVSVP